MKTFSNTAILLFWRVDSRIEADMRIDAHQHFWRIDRGDYGWLTRESVPDIYRDFLPQDLTPLLAACDIDRTILVQCAPTVEETRFLLDVAASTPAVAGVVGWVDLSADDAERQISELANAPCLRGLRPMLQDLPDDDWILQGAVAAGIAAMTRHNLRFDALVFPRHLPVMREFLARHPDLAVVIDHCAKPYIAEGRIREWAEHMKVIASESDAYCKLSGLVTEAAPGWTEETLKPYVETVMNCFGPSRVMWGSDWPVLTLALDYAGWFRLARNLTSMLSEDDLAMVFGGTAAAFYDIEA
jgi:L-fuconolactonase